MIIFVDDDAGLRNWLVHHRNGYALEGMRNRKAMRLIMHAAACPQLRDAVHHGRATTHRRWIACSLREDELTSWCADEYFTAPPRCEICLPSTSPLASDVETRHLTRLARDVLDYVLDVAVIHLDPEARPYRLTISDVAHCLQKTPGRLGAAFEQLIGAELIVVDDSSAPRRMKPENRGVYPTSAALRTLPYFAEWDPDRVAGEAAKLRAEER